MNVRTIQHPGVETREIDLTEYFAATPVTNINNAYVMGFTQKGPIYDCSWITSQAEFLAVYGEPKTEAERYLYYAVQSILANGGNPIVSRMPYDNKQCKTYKGLSLTYGSYDGKVGVYDQVNNSASTIIPLENVANFLTDDMQEVGLSAYIFPKYSTVKVTQQFPKGYILWQDLSLLSATINDVSILSEPANFNNYFKTTSPALVSGLSENFNNENVKEYIKETYTNTHFKNLYKSITKYFDKQSIKTTLSGFNFTDVQYITSNEDDGYNNSIKLKSTDTDINKLSGSFNNIFTTTTPGFEASDSVVSISGGNIYQASGNLSAVTSACFANCDLTLGELIVNLCPTYSDTYKSGEDVIYRGENLNYIQYQYNDAAIAAASTNVSGFFGNRCSGSLSGITNAFNLTGTESTYRTFTINDIAPSALGVNYQAASTLFNNVKTATTFSLSTTVADITTDKLMVTLYDDTNNIGTDDLLRVYNDPMFYDFSNEAIASVDAKLMIDPAVGYENILTVVSKDVELTNDQYDGLVTTNNFQTEPDETYGKAIDTANYVIVDKLKTLTAGSQGNEGYFVTVIDPFDAIKMQRLLVNPVEIETNYNAVSSIEYWGQNSDINWQSVYDNAIDSLDTLTRVKNADGIWVGEPGIGDKTNIMDSWSVPLSGAYIEDSISKILMQSFKQIPLTSAGDSTESCIDKCYSTHIIVAVCKTGVNPSDGKITVNVVETFFGSLFDEFDENTGASLYIGNLINQNSNYIEFYKNRYVQPGFGGESSKEPYNKTTVNQVYLKGSMELKDAAAFAGIDTDQYDINQEFVIGDKFCYKSWDDINNYFINHKDDKTYPPECGRYYYLGSTTDIFYKDLSYNSKTSEYQWAPVHMWKKTYDDFASKCKSKNINIFDKKKTCLYNLYQNAYFTSFSQKEAQKVIANTTGMYSPVAGANKKVANNFIQDMDRCISFIDNTDEIPIFFVADAGLSTIAQFTDNVNWDSTTGKWITQTFDPDNDPDMEDRFITSFGDVATWKKVIEKLNYISETVRNDCMTIIDAPRQLTLDGQAPKLRPSAWDNNFDTEIGKKLRFISGLNSSYTAGYYNWVRMTDSFTGIAFWLPPTSKLIGNLVYLNAVNYPWLAPAGTMYGRISGIHAISHNPNASEEDQIYLKNWNYIKQYPTEGFIVEGQKTTLTKNSAFNRINVRTLFLDIERFLTNVGRGFRYKVNNQFTREQFIQTIKPKLEDYAVRQGITDYLIKCDETLNTPEVVDANELRAIIYIKPGRLIEYIVIDCVATKSGAVLSEITY